MNKNFSLNINKIQIKKGILCSLFIFVCSLLFKSIRLFTPSIIEIRMENVFSPVIGLYFGTVGAIACAFGNFFATIFNDGNSFNFNIGVINLFFDFLYAYIPYKLWYAFNIKDEYKLPKINNINGILRYSYIIFLDSITVTLLLKLSISLIENSNISLKFILLEFFNNYNFQVIIGVILLIAFSTTDISPYIPKTNVIARRNIHYEYFLYFSLFLSLYGILVREKGLSLINNVEVITMLLISYVLMIMFIIAPIMNKKNTVEMSKIKGAFSIRERVSIGLLMFVIIFIFILYILVYILLNNYVNSDGASQIYTTICISSYFIFGVAILTLKRIEKTITIPIQTLFNLVDRFAKSDYEKIINQNDLKEQCKAIRTGDEIEELAIAFCRMMSDIQEYVKNFEEAAMEKERAEAELMAATKIQSSLLPSVFPAFPQRNDFEIFANMRPAKGVSGDFYDFYLFGDRLAFVIADVSGKGVPAALFMMTAKSVIKNSFLSSNDIREVARKVNNELCENNEALMFVTAFLGIIDLKTGIMRYVNAGHIPPLLKHDFGIFKYINIKNNCILGIIPNADFEKQEMNLNKGDILFLYTDGVTEAMDSCGNLYGMNRLKDVLNKGNMKSGDIYEIIPMVIKDIDDFCKGEKQTDDITMLTFKYLKIRE